MVLIINNRTASALSYLSGAVIVPASSTLNVSSEFHYRLSTDGQLRFDLSNDIADLRDGVNQYSSTDAINYLDKFHEVLADKNGNGLTSTTVVTDLTTKQSLDVNIVTGTSIGSPDRNSFTYGDTSQTVVGGVFNDTGATVPTGRQAAARITEQRAFHTNLRDNSGAELGTAGNPLRVGSTGVTTTNTGFVVSTANNTTTPLTTSATYTGAWEDISSYQSITIAVTGGPTNAPGTLFFEFSPDNGTTVPLSIPTFLLNPSAQIPIPLRSVYRFFRTRYVNGTVAQTTFRLDVNLHYHASEDLTRFTSQVVQYNEPLKNVRSFVEIAPGPNKTILAADKEIFGGAVTLSRTAHIQGQFELALGTNNITASTTGTGTLPATSLGRLVIAAGTGVTGSSRVISNAKVLYQSGREVYSQFDLAFTTPTSVNSTQRAGLYDTSNGFFLELKTNGFAVGVRTGAVDTLILRSVFTDDLLDGNSASRFTRNYIPEAVDFTKLNSYRIRFGNGSASICYEILSPDGQWVTFHRIRQSNLSAIPSIQTPILPMTMEAIKASADAQNVQMFSSYWDAGVVAEVTPQQSSHVRTYSAATANFTVTSVLPTDVFTITGSTNRVVRVQRIGVSGTRNSAGIATMSVIKRSSPNTGGTETIVPNVSHDSLDVTSAAVVRVYSGVTNPTLGTTVGTVRVASVFLPTGALNTSSNEYVFDFETVRGKEMILNSANEILAINLGGLVSIAGLNMNFWVEWTEE